MSPRRVRSMCTSGDCTEPARARGLCWAHYGNWRRSVSDEPLPRIPDGALTAAQAAAHLGVTRDTLSRYVAAGTHRPDGRAQGRNWWWPATVKGWTRQQPPDDAVNVREAAALLGLSPSRVYTLAREGRLPPDGHVGGRKALWWHRQTVADFRQHQPHNVLWTTDVARLLGVSRETVRRLANTTLPPDGSYRGRRWWATGRFEATTDTSAPTNEGSGT